ncbi:hypothetical protein NQ317_006065, partial [Molorchus minor]
KLVDETTSQEQLLRSSKQELSMVQQDYEKERRLKDSAIHENRTEDLITQKELERTEILDQFKCLSEEAQVLESSNHTLESEATQSRVQLSVALDHASDLERKADNQHAIIRSYEKQITELTSQVASLEMQMKQGEAEYDRLAIELKQMKDLCVKLDHEKDGLRRELGERDNQQGQKKERNNLEGLEKLLNEARQDVVNQRLQNQELQAEINRLRAKVDDLQERLTTSTEQLDLFQEKALEYSQQNKQLRREIANERFLELGMTITRDTHLFNNFFFLPVDQLITLPIKLRTSEACATNIATKRNVRPAKDTKTIIVTVKAIIVLMKEPAEKTVPIQALARSSFRSSRNRPRKATNAR